MAASASGGRDWYAALPLPWRIDSLDYVLRSIGAAALALGLGLYLQLDSPFSAASTVLLLINPVQGAVVGKGWWRAVGTLVGTLAAFVLTALFAQKMLLFVVALGFWLGLCVGVMSLVRHFYATAAVVAGYTVCLALGSAMVEPEAAFEHIVTRASAVIVGVCCLSLVTVLFSRRTVSGRVRQRLVSLCAATLALVAARHAGAADGELERRRRTLAGEVYAVDDLLGVGRAESRALSAALPAIRGGLAALFSTLMEFRFAGETHWARRLAERGLALPMADDLRLLGGQLERGELDFAGAARRLASLRGRLAAIRRGLPTDQADACREGLFMERLDEQLDDLQAALRGSPGSTAGPAPTSAQRPSIDITARPCATAREPGWRCWSAAPCGSSAGGTRGRPCWRCSAPTARCWQPRPFPPRARAISFAARSTRYLPHCSANSFCYR